MYKSKPNLLISGLIISFFTCSGILNAMQETKSKDNSEKNKQLSVISLPNKERSVTPYDPSIEQSFKERYMTEKQIDNKKIDEESNKAKLEQEPVKKAPQKPVRPPKSSRKKATNMEPVKTEQVKEEEKANDLQIRSLTEEIKKGNFKLRKTGLKEKLIKEDTVQEKPVFTEKVEPIIFYTSSKINMESLFNELNIALKGSKQEVNQSIKANMTKIINIVVAAAGEIKKINNAQPTKFNISKTKLVALIKYAYTNSPEAIKGDLQLKIKKLGDLGIDFDSPVFDKNTFK